MLALGGCGIGGLGQSQSSTSTQAAASSVESLATELRTRARAVRRNDRDAFLAGVSSASSVFADEQRIWFDNVQQLPIARFRYSFDESSVQDVGAEVSVSVRQHLQLEGYDARPVVTVRRMRFVREQTTTGTPLRLAAVSVAASGGGTAEPWDLGPIQVREGRGVLGIFDDDSVRRAGDVLGAVSAGIDDVASAVPYAWDRRVVVYALSDTEALASVEDLPGGDADRLDGLAFPVPVRTGAKRVAGHRFMLHPRMLTRDGVARDRLVRHELTHVALGELDDRVPTWFAEGLAEYLSVQSIPLQDRVISRDALTLAREGVDDLPGNNNFNGPLSGANYGLSWWACEHIASTYGVGMLWTLFEAFRENASGLTTDDVLRRELGISAGALAREAAARIVSTFD